MSIEVPLGKDVNLQFTIVSTTEKALQFRYDVENVSDSDLYIFNRLYRTYTDAGVFELDANLVYVYLKEGLVHLTKRVPDIPRGVLVEIPIVPCVTVLRRGERTGETFDLSLPLKTFDPYLPRQSSIITNYDAVEFSLGYGRASGTGRRSVNYVRTNQGQVPYVYMNPLDQLIARTAPVSVSRAGAHPPLQGPCPKCGAIPDPGGRFCSQCGAPLR